MPLNPAAFASELNDYFSNEDEGKDIASTSAIIVDSYVENFVEAGADPLSQNSLVVLPSKVDALKAAFERMFTLALESNTPLNLGLVAPVLIAFWAGGLLSTSGLVPGTTATISAVVTVPGVATPIPFPPAGPTAAPFVTVLQTFFLTHILTVNYLIVGLVPAAPSPIPTPFPSIGYI